MTSVKSTNNNPDWISEIVSAWCGHRPFSDYIVKTLGPQVIVELGVDLGFSSFCFSQALTNHQLTDSRVYGVDLFQGDPQTGFRNTKDQVESQIKAHQIENLELVQGEFGQVAKTWNRVIDILHIDGYHTEDAVASDFNHWAKFVADTGIILFHDVYEFSPGFGAYQFFNKIEGYHKAYFTHSHGLGLATKNKALYDRILADWPDIRTGPIVSNRRR